MQFAVQAAQPLPIRATKGKTITFINQNAALGTDIFFSTDRAQLARTASGVAPDGTRLAAGGTVLQWSNFPGVVWVRAAADTTGLEVLG